MRYEIAGQEAWTTEKPKIPMKNMEIALKTCKAMSSYLHQHWKNGRREERMGERKLNYATQKTFFNAIDRRKILQPICLLHQLIQIFSCPSGLHTYINRLLKTEENQCHCKSAECKIFSMIFEIIRITITWRSSWMSGISWAKGNAACATSCTSVRRRSVGPTPPTPSSPPLTWASCF